MAYAMSSNTVSNRTDSMMSRFAQKRASRRSRVHARRIELAMSEEARIRAQTPYRAAPSNAW